MFSGIIEEKQIITRVEVRPEDQQPENQQQVDSANEAKDVSAVTIEITQPKSFDDLKLGDSIAVDGVCLTLEKLVDSKMQFTLGYETLQVLKIPSMQASQKLLGKVVNLERSLRFGDRIHGHLVTGHVDTMGVVARSQMLGGSLLLDVQVPLSYQPWVWIKGSICLHGVSLTVNQIQSSSKGSGLVISVCLIPETISRTNLSLFTINDLIHVEFDYYAKAIINYEKNKV